MTKSKNLLKNHNYLDISLMDVMKLLDPSGSSKYIDLIHKLGPKTRVSSINWEDNGKRIHELETYYGFSQEVLAGLKKEEIYHISSLVAIYFNSAEINLINQYHQLIENNLIENKDFSQINSFEDLAGQIALANIKKTDKEIEKLVKIILRNDEWLVLRPLSNSASLKYGANTKWCTASIHDNHYFYRYARRGILIYIINMKTGNKTAFFHSLDREEETSFWNVIDKRIDSFDSDLTPEILNVVKHEMKSNTISNWNLLSDKQQMNLRKTDFIEESKKGYNDELVAPHNEERAEAAPMRGGNVIINTAPIAYATQEDVGDLLFTVDQGNNVEIMEESIYADIPTNINTGISQNIGRG